MFDTPESRLERLLAHAVTGSLRFSIPLLAAALLVTGLSVVYISGHLGINTDTSDMLAPTLEWRRTYIAYERAFPQYADTIAVVVDGQTPDLAEDAAAELTVLLAARRDLFADVSYIQDDPHFRRNQLLYLEVPALESLAEQLAAAQPFLVRLAADPSLRGFFGLLTEALTRAGEVPMPQLARTMDQVGAVVDSVRRGAPRPLSWQELMAGTTADADDRRRVIVVKPILDFSELLPGKTAVLAIRDLARAEGMDAAHGVRVRVTGSAALGYEELQSVSRGAARAGILAFILVGLCLVWGLRSASLIFATLVVLVMGLILTAAFAALTIGELNMISVAFAVLYVGLASAYAIHYALRARELLDHHDKPQALTLAAVHVGGSMTLCALTTAVGFYAFIPTAYRGVAELGVIAGTSMLFGLVLTVTVLPAMLLHLPIKPPRVPVSRPALDGFARFPILHARAITIGAGGVALLSLAVMPGATFDHNPVHLQDPETESVQTFRDLLAESARSPYSIVVVADDAGAAAQLRERLLNLPSVDSVVSIDSFIPADQEDKLAIIDDLALTLGPELDPAAAQATPAPAAQWAAMHALVDVLALPPAAGSAPGLTAAAKRLQDALIGLLDAAAHADDHGTRLLDTLQRALLAALPSRIDRLQASLSPQPVSLATLPPTIRERWVTADGHLRLEVLPKRDLDDNGALLEFVTDVRSVAGATATDTPVIIVEAGKAVVLAFQQAFGIAIVVIALLLWVILRNLREVWLSLAPLLLAGLLTCALTVVTGQAFNFANIIALPLLLGIGVDNALHILHRYRTDLPADGLLLRTSTARAVWFSALTTACSFGNLAISPHLGTASMGVMLTIGLATSVLYALIVLPSFLTLMPLRASGKD